MNCVSGHCSGTMSFGRFPDLLITNGNAAIDSHHGALVVALFLGHTVSVCIDRPHRGEPSCVLPTKRQTPLHDEPRRTPAARRSLPPIQPSDREMPVRSSRSRGGSLRTLCDSYHRVCFRRFLRRSSEFCAVALAVADRRDFLPSQARPPHSAPLLNTTKTEPDV